MPRNGWSTTLRSGRSSSRSARSTARPSSGSDASANRSGSRSARSRSSAHGSRFVAAGKVELAFAGDNGAGAVTAIKYRPARRLLARHDAESAVDLAAADRRRQARLARLARRRGRDRRSRLVRARRRRRRGRSCSRPALARFKPRVGGADPARRTVALCPRRRRATATTAPRRPRRSSAARTLRVRPPVDGGDWCDWDGGRDEFLELVRGSQAGRASSSRRSPSSSRIRSRRPSRCSASPARSSSPVGSLLMVYGADGSGKSTWTIDGIAHLAAGVDWLGDPGAAARAGLHHRERRPAEPLPGEARGEDRELGRPRLRTQRVRLPGAVGRVHVRRPRSARGARRVLRGARDRRRHREPDARARRRRVRPARRDAAVRRLARRVRPQARARVLAPAPREQGRPDLRRLGPPPRHEGAARSRTATSRARSSTGRRRAGRRCRARRARAPACSSGSSRRRGTASSSSTAVGASDSELERADRRLPHASIRGRRRRAVNERVTGTQQRIRKLLDGDRFDCVNGPRGSILWNLASDRVGDRGEEPTQ